MYKLIIHIYKNEGVYEKSLRFEVKSTVNALLIVNNILHLVNHGIDVEDVFESNVCSSGSYFDMRCIIYSDTKTILYRDLFKQIKCALDGYIIYDFPFKDGLFLSLNDFYDLLSLVLDTYKEDALYIFNGKDNYFELYK